MGVMTEMMIEEGEKEGAIADAAEELFIDSSKSARRRIFTGFTREEREEIQRQVDQKWEDFDNGELPGWRD